MKALSLTQPWATLVAIGAKRVETRSWPTNYRGPLAIHAAKTFPRWARDLCDELPFADALWDFLPDGTAASLPRGAIVAVARLAGCVRFTQSRSYQLPDGVSLKLEVGDSEYAFGDITPGRYGFILSDVLRLVEPIPCRGALGLWTPPADVLARLDGLAVRA